MDFTTAVQHALGNLMNFKDRARRSEFWWFYLLTAIVYVIASIVASIIILPIFYTGIIVVLWILTIPVSVRRLHDADKSGWWLLIFFVPLIGFLLLLYWFVTRGTVGPNRFGPDPYDA